MIRPFSALHTDCAQYALLRQQKAVRRVLLARDAEETAVAARWARAWHRLVQQQLATAMDTVSQQPFSAHHSTARHQLH